MSVWSAYHCLRQGHQSINRNVDQQPTNDATCIWKAKVWPKIKSFMWKLVYNLIAVRSNLVWRGIQVSPLCPACDAVETREHMLTGCPWTRHLWQMCLGLNVADAGIPSVEVWLDSLLSTTRRIRADRENKWRLCMIICWQISKARCKLVFENKPPNLGVIVQQVTETVGELQAMQIPLPRTVNPNPNQEWRKPASWCLSSR